MGMVAAMRFVSSGRYAAPVALGLTLGGIPSVLIAVWLVRSLLLDIVRWGVIVFTCRVRLDIRRYLSDGGEASELKGLRRSFIARARLRQQSLENERICRLRQVRVESSFSGAALVAILPPTGDGNDERALSESLLTNSPAGFITVHSWHPDVERVRAGGLGLSSHQG